MHDKERPAASRSYFWRWGAGALLAAVLVVLGLLFRGHPPSAAAPSKPSNRAHSVLFAGAKPALTASGASIGKTGNDASKVEICGIGKVTLDTSNPLAAYRYIDGL